MATVAYATGLKQSTISKIERGEYYGLPHEIIIILALFYNVKLISLIPDIDTDN